MAQSEPTPYERMGGETGVRALVDRFYDIMDADERASEIRAMHPSRLDGSRTKLFEFLSGWLGGPPLYIAKRGHPRLRARHLPFPIGDQARDQWMMCMRDALAEHVPDREVRDFLDSAFMQMATHLRNKRD